MIDDPTSQLTPEGQLLKESREILGYSNDLCPICQDEDSFGEPCDACIREVALAITKRKRLWIQSARR